MSSFTKKTATIGNDSEINQMHKKYKSKKKSSKMKRQVSARKEMEEIQQLKERIKAELGTNGTAGDVARFSKFSDLPISKYLVQSLRAAKFTKLTKIQRMAIPQGLVGSDILGAAKTGSGKTLAFLIPLMEKLYRNRWGEADGLGGLIISPTRELAMQIFEVFRTIGEQQGLTGALVVGGKSFAEEGEHVASMNIIIGTPGRILQHLEQTPQFDSSSLQVLVLDEADRILDMGFEEELNSILNYMPPSSQRQTMLFSATQTKSVKQIARLSLNNPQYVAVHEEARFATPERLDQHFAVVKLFDKLNVVWSFIKSHLRQKTIIFFSSCKQVRFAFEVYRRMRPGVPLMALHGKIKQGKRMFIFNDFKNKKAAVLMATDIAARGLDFPSVDWVLQADCPEDPATYIHRVGRTARFKDKGKALLLLLPNEEKPFVDLLRKKKIPIKRTAINMQRTANIMGTLQSLAASDPDMKFLAQKSFIAYVKSVYLQRNKNVFDVNLLPLEEYAAALGLPGKPNIKFLNKNKQGGKSSSSSDNNIKDNSSKEDSVADKIRLEAHKKKNKSYKLQQLKEKIKKEKAKRKKLREEGKAAHDSDQSSDEEDTEKKKPSRRTEEGKLERMLSRKNDGVLSTVREKMRGDKSDEDDGNNSDDGVLVLKRKIPYEKNDASNNEVLQEFYSSQIPKKIRTSGHGKNKKLKFDEEGNPITAFEKLVAEKNAIDNNNDNLYVHDVKGQAELYANKVRQRLALESKTDKDRNRERIQEKRLKRKEKLKEEQEERLAAGIAVGGLSNIQDNDSENSSSGGSSSNSSSSSSSSSDSDDE
jgi:ATP-dependent RNA helicase DDX10/DBP4